MSIDKIFTLAVLVFLIAAAVKDIKSYKIPDVVSILIFVTGIVKIIVLSEMRKGSAAGLLCAVILTFVCKLVMKGGFGFGDVKLIIALGFFMGIDRFLPFMAITSVVAAVTVVDMLIFKKMKRKDVIPFAPFVAAGYFFNMIFLHFGGRIV